MAQKPHIVIIPKNHHGYEVVLIKFNFDQELVQIARSIGCRWSRTHQSWYLNNRPKELKAIYKVFQQKALINKTQLSKLSGTSSNKRKNKGRKLNLSSEEKIFYVIMSNI